MHALYGLVGTATAYRWTVHGLSAGKARDLLFSKTVQTNSVAHTAFYSISTGILSHG